MMEQRPFQMRLQPNWEVIPVGEKWMEQFRSFKATAFRLEILQAYNEPSETDAFEAFLRGDSVSKEYIAGWCNLVRDHITADRKMSRVHLVDLPFTDYIRFEIEHAYTHTSEAGEHILLLDRNKIDQSLAPLVNEDFWLLDDNKVMVQDYDDSGALKHSRISTDPGTVGYYRKIQGEVQALGVPFQDLYNRETGIRI